MRHVLPIIERELRVQARRPLARWTRLGLTAVATLLVANYVSSWSLYRSPGQNGMAFQVLAWTGFLLALAAAFFTADAISSERREGTLGLLFLTDLSGLEVTVGKVSAALVTGVYVFIGFAPVLMLALLPGGVTGGEVARVTLVLVATLLVALSVGAWISVRQEDGLSASRQTAVCVLGLVAIPWLLEALVTATSRATGLSPLKGWISLFSPAATFRLASDAAYRTETVRFWLSLVFLFVEGALLLFFSGRILGRNWREASAAKTPADPAAIGSPRKRPCDETNPIGWLVRRQRGQRALFWLAGVLLLLLSSNLLPQVILIAVSRTGSAQAIGTLISALSLVGSAAAFALCGLASGRFFLEARNTGELELLCSTPQGARQIVWGQQRALKSLLIGPCLLQLLLLPIIGVTLFGRFMGAGVSLPLFYSLSALIEPLETILNLWAATWLGLWFGIRSRNIWSLMAWTTGLLLGASMVFSSALWMIIVLLGAPVVTGTAPNLSLLLYVFLRPALQIAAPLVLMLWARRKLKHFEVLLPERETFGAWGRRELERLGSAISRARHWTKSGPN
jgi:ABC-type transport system involved in multi-copper enzyme maturation permease subunit